MTHFWVTGANGVTENTLVRYYIDGETSPSIAFLPPLVIFDLRHILDTVGLWCRI